MIREVLVAVMLLAGSTAMLLAAIGLVRFSDVLCRAHALAKATTFGICLLLLALWVALDEEIAGLKLFLVIAFLFLTIPMAGHLIALLAFRQKRRDERATRRL